jgi:uncharacterized protein
MFIYRIWLAVLVMGWLGTTVPADEPGKLRAPLVEGQNNHGIWPKTSLMMRHYLEQTGIFEVEIVRTAPEGTDPNFRPDFSRYDVVVSNYNGARWPRETELRWDMRTIRWDASV